MFNDFSHVCEVKNNLVFMHIVSKYLILLLLDGKFNFMYMDIAKPCKTSIIRI